MRRIHGFLASLGAVEIVSAILLAVYGATWIIVHATARGMAHTLFQVLALAESVVAILLVRRKPLGSLLSILAVYLLVDLEPLTLPPALFALGTLAAMRGPRAVLVGACSAATAVLLLPYVHGDTVSASSAAWHVAAVVVAVSSGLLLRKSRCLTAAAFSGLNVPLLQDPGEK